MLPANYFPSDMPLELQLALSCDMVAFGSCAWRRRPDGSYEAVKPYEMSAVESATWPWRPLPTKF